MYSLIDPFFHFDVQSKLFTELCASIYKLTFAVHLFNHSLFLLFITLFKFIIIFIYSII